MSQGRRLRERVAGQSAMSDVVLARSAAGQRGFLARLIGVSPLDSTTKIPPTNVLGVGLIQAK